MTLQVSIQQAACNALATHLAAQLTDCTVRNHWPEASQQLPEKAITIVFAGPRRDELVEERIVNVAAATDTTVNVTWSLGFCEQPIQIDVWARYHVTRDDILARLEGVLRSSGTGTGTDGATTDLRLTLGNGWSGYVDFQLSDIEVINNPESIKASEYRGIVRGTITMPILKTTTVAKIDQIKLKDRIYHSDPMPSGTVKEATTITADGVTYSTE